MTTIPVPSYQRVCLDITKLESSPVAILLKVAFVSLGFVAKGGIASKSPGCIEKKKREMIENMP